MSRAEDTICSYEKKHGVVCPDDKKTAIINYFTFSETKEMFCPICKNELVFVDWIVVYGICGEENRCKYVCTNDDCELHKFESFWDDNGEFYSKNLPFERMLELFPTNEYSAKNSISCQSDKTIYKKGLKDKTYLSPIFCLWFLKPYIEHCYNADNYGIITKKWYKLKFLKREKGSKTYNIYYLSGVHMFMFNFREYRKHKKSFLKYPATHDIQQLLSYFELSSWDKRWWKISFNFLINIFQKKLYKQLKDQKIVLSLQKK